MIAGGYSGDSALSNFVGFVRDKAGAITTFDAPGAINGTAAVSINNSGAIAGSYVDADGVSHGFVRDKAGAITTVDAPGAIYGTAAVSINDSGTIVGYDEDGSFVFHGFVLSK